MTRKKINYLTQQKELVVLQRLEKFAKRNNIELFNVKGSLFDRVRTIANNNGRCPCFSDRPHCPCKQCIQEVKDKGECGCRVFITKRR
ncbi:hypothetical protein ES705_29785 [subsurface metagenome]